MNTIDCIKSRRSVRKFTEEKVPHEVLEQLVELARWAPSWKNTQIARYVAVEDEALKNRIAEEATIPWNEGIIKGAPVLAGADGDDLCGKALRLRAGRQL